MIRKILVVDDDQVLQLTLSRRMAAFDEQFQVVQAVDGFDALKKLEESAFSLVITDLMMPRMDGMSLISHIQNRYSDLPVIIISGLKRKDVPNIEKVKGIVAYLEKPIAVNKLLELIVSTLDEETQGGLLYNISPTMFMQLMEMEEKTCTIRMLDNASDEGGILYLVKGRLLDARVGELKGMEAVSRVFFWDEVTVFLRHECADRENVINSGIQPLIMAALAAKDEQEALPSSDGEVAGTALKAGSVDTDVLQSVSETGNKQLEDLRLFLEGELGEQVGVGAIYREAKMAVVNDRLNQLGALSGFGTLEVGCMEQKQGGNILLIPGTPPTLLEAKADAPLTEILAVLKK